MERKILAKKPKIYKEYETKYLQEIGKSQMPDYIHCLVS